MGTTSKQLIGLLACIVALAVSASMAVADDKAFVWNKDDPDLEWAGCPEFMPEGCGIAVLQGDPADHNADIFFKLPGNSTAPHHWHTSAERMVLVAGELHIDFDGQDPVIMRPGTYAYGPPKLPHVADCRSAEPCILFIAFEKPIDAIPTD